MEANAEAIVEHEVDETPESAIRIDIIDVENPAYISMNGPLPGMIKRFVDNDLVGVPSIKYESLLNYFSTIVEGIFRQRITGVHENLIQSKFQIGSINGVLLGFQLFHMLPNRLPHVQTLNWAYIYSEHPKITYRFTHEVCKYQKKWKAQFISATLTNSRIEKVVSRICKKHTVGGTYYTVRGVKDALIRC